MIHITFIVNKTNQRKLDTEARITICTNAICTINFTMYDNSMNESGTDIEI